MRRFEFDLSPLFRSAVGFDRTSRLLNSAFEQLGDSVPAYPPYNIERLEGDAYQITMAVAGFGEADIEITVAENRLLVKGHGSADSREKAYLHKGIAGRSFERGFQLADHIVVTAARLANGMLEIDLLRELPEAMKPRTIEIITGKKAKRLAAKAA